MTAETPDVKRLSVLLLVVVVVLAGCSAGGDSAPTTDDQVSVPDDLPGVSADGVDADALVAAHNDALANQSYRLDVDQQIGTGALEITALVDAGRLPALIDVRGQGANRVNYVTDNASYELRRTNGDRIVRQIEANASMVPTGEFYIREVLGDANYSYNGTVRHEGQQLHRIRADRGDLTRQFDNGTVTDFESNLLLDEDGLVHSISYRITVERGNTQSTLDVYLSVWRLGQTTVDEPDWIDEAGTDPNTTTRTLSNADLGATLSVSGPAANVTTVSLSNASTEFYTTDVIEQARVSAIASATANQSVSLESVQLSYDSGAVPNDDADGLFVFVYHPTYETLIPMETSFDPANETVEATRIDPETTVPVDGAQVHPSLDGLTAGDYAFVVMHGQTYWDAFENDSGS